MTVAVSKPSQVIRAVWGLLSNQGWDGGHPHLTTLYPMPGDDRFDDDAQFVGLPIFPGRSGSTVHAGDRTWQLPLAWFRELETRPESQTLLKFDIYVPGAGRLSATPKGAALITIIQKAMYLEAFRARKPLAVSTFRRRLPIYGAFAKVALASGKPIHQLDYADLAEAVALMNKSERECLPSVYETVRWWKARAGAKCPFFEPPPSPEALLTTDVSGGFDPSKVREDEPPTEDVTWQPLPDNFVAAAGNIAVDLVEAVRPVLLRCLAELAEYREHNGQFPPEEQVRAIICRYDWPAGFRPDNYADLRQRCRQAQTATILLLSLLLGPRTSEVLGIPRRQVVQMVADGHIMHFLRGTTFKLSQNYGGESRDWPIHEILGEALTQQDAYIDLTEGEHFQYLWKQHLELFGGSACLKDLDGQLRNFVKQFNLEAYLDGTRCHHHGSAKRQRAWS